jgi:hypothetical protein
LKGDEVHASVIEARQYRDRERQRKNDNIRKRQAQGLVRALGAEPARMPCLHPEGNSRQRRVNSRGDRNRRRVFRIVKWIMVMGPPILVKGE